MAEAGVPKSISDPAQRHCRRSGDSAVDRVIRWAMTDQRSDFIEDESLFLYGIILGWFLTTSNRPHRDLATKALVRLFTNRLPVLLRTLQVLYPVNDPYVLERMLAAAYGAVVRSSDLSSLAAVAQWVYGEVFKHKNPPPNILIRDYARNIIEFALHKRSDIKIVRKRIRPPYSSDFSESIPSRDQLDSAYGWENKENGPGWYSIYSSVLRDGDFARYVIGTNVGSFRWVSVRLQDPAPKLSKYPSRTSSFDLDLAQRWIFNRVVELGWRPELFADFDDRIDSASRRSDKPERIGKKYQWIAFYE